MRSGTSKRRWRGTSGVGQLDVEVVEVVAVLARDLEHVAEAARWSSSAVRAPLRSISAFVTSVVPWTR